LLLLCTALLQAPAARGAVFEWGDPYSFDDDLLVPADWDSGGGDLGAAGPYPAELRVFGLPGPVLHMRAAIGDGVHTDPQDMDVLLVAPGGEHAMLMSDACGTPDLELGQLAFDDDAAAYLPIGSGCESGLFKPTNAQFDAMPPPAPPVPSGSIAYSASLSAFEGTDPNGIWRLYVYDDGQSDPVTGGVGIFDTWALQFHIKARCRGRRATLVGVDRRGDYLVGKRRKDVIQAFGGGDFVAGKRGRDVLCGGKGRDALYGGAGPDLLIGGRGADRLIGGRGRDRCIGGPGRDRVESC
jgi:hypothetical protein